MEQLVLERLDGFLIVFVGLCASFGAIFVALITTLISLCCNCSFKSDSTVALLIGLFSVSSFAGVIASGAISCFLSQTGGLLHATLIGGTNGTSNTYTQELQLEDGKEKADLLASVMRRREE